jgi:uncharacterized protein with ParB-like and HNH nuclease domain
MIHEKAALEEELGDLNNVDDDQDGDEDTSIASDLYSISSFGVDLDVEALVKRLTNNTYYVPDFQRQYVWSQTDASKFIESLLLGLPVPGIFLYKESDTTKHLVIDGQQRLRSLQKYHEGIFREKKFRLTGLQSKWNNLSYRELTEDDQGRLDQAIVHATIFKQDTPTESMNSVYEVFERINTGGMKLSPQEIRSCVAHGEFNSLLFKLNKNKIWRELFGKESTRLKDVELILRFFAFNENLGSYERPMKQFLTDFMTSNRGASGEIQERRIREWETLMESLSKSLGSRPFRPSGRALNAAFFDSFTVALSEQLKTGAAPTAENVINAHDSLLENDEFMKAISSSTADDENVKTRFRLASASFVNSSAA